LFLPFFHFLETSSSFDESYSLEEEHSLILLVLIFILSLLFLDVSFSSLFMRSFKVGAFKPPVLELSSTMMGLSSSSNFCGTSCTSLVLDIVSPND
jgi:hypothetical protein